MKRCIAALLLACFVLLMGFAAYAAPVDITPASSVGAEAASSNNLNHWDYWDWSNWSQPVRSYLYNNGDGTLTRVEYTGSVITVEVYDSQYHCTSVRTVEMELPLFGGFFCGSQYNFIVFGQENLSESDGVEVIRTVKYTKDWQRVASVGIYGANTYIPFEAGSLRADEANGLLFVRTCHEMYQSSDGYHHQANLTYTVNISSMSIVDSYYIVMNPSAGYASHSFNQFIKVDGTKLVALDHGDAYPRSAALFLYTRPVGSNTLQGGAQYVNTVSYPGNTGANFTGSCVGGLEVTSYGYMTVGNSSQSTSSSAQRNIYLTVTNRSSFSSSGTTTVWLTNYASNAGITMGNPQLIKINDDKLMVMWRENSTVKYVFVNGSGQLISSVTADTSLKMSDCLPIIVNGRAVWYVTTGSTPVFCSVPVADALAGDVNGDGAVNATDALTVLRYSLGLISEIAPNADVDGNGVINASDALLILRAALGLVTL